jgi:hypothetical protein
VFPVDWVAPLLASFSSGHHSFLEGEEAGTKKETEREHVGRATKASELFKGTRRRPLTSCPFTEWNQSQPLKRRASFRITRHQMESKSTAQTQYYISPSHEVTISVLHDGHLSLGRHPLGVPPDSPRFSETVRPATYMQ